MDKVLWVAGVVAAFVVAHIYYRLTVSKSLSFFLLLDDRPLSHVHPDVRARLKVYFFAPDPAPAAAEAAAPADAVHAESITVGALQHLQVVVANTGTRAIQFVEQPTIALPGSAVILDATVIFQRPADLGASLTILPVSPHGPQKVQLAAPLLNKGECFIAKFLISDSVDASSLELHLLSEDLPRTVKIKALPVESTKSFVEAVEWPAVFVGAPFAVLAFVSLLTQVTLYKAHMLPSPLQVGARQFFGVIGWIHVELLFGVIGSVLFGLMGLGLLLGVGLEPLFRARRIVLPAEIRPSSVFRVRSTDDHDALH